jgi:hypothetical protein
MLSVAGRDQNVFPPAGPCVDDENECLARRRRSQAGGVAELLRLLPRRDVFSPRGKTPSHSRGVMYNGRKVMPSFCA